MILTVQCKNRFELEEVEGDSDYLIVSCKKIISKQKILSLEFSRVQRIVKAKKMETIVVTSSSNHSNNKANT